MGAESSHDLELLLDYLKRNRGFDFTGYKSSSVSRRVRRRMQSVGIETYADYIDYLEVHPEEFAQLFNTILINVTSFFRDADTWTVLAEQVIPQILDRKQAYEPVRVWTAGCASGEEAYSIAMLLMQALGPDQYRERVKVYATDLDEEALAHARQGVYSEKDVAEIPAVLRETCLESAGALYTLPKDLRRNVIFGRHDLIQDAPISRIDLLTCRNTLMYFNAETQGRILARFHFALNDGGILSLGRAEMMFTHSNLFQPLDMRRRIFVKVARPNLRDRLLLMAQAGSEDAAGRIANHVRMREAAFDSGIYAQLVLDANGVVIMANEQARTLLHVSARDIGRPLQDLEVSYRPVELRSVIEQAWAEHRAVLLRDIAYVTATGALSVDVQVMPLFENGGPAIGTLVTFIDVTGYKRLRDDLQDTNQELEAAYEELQSTSEELETTNEELQSTVEELETTNEELQSTNEELETMNEELQSTNEELQTMNDELRLRSDELNRANAFMASILRSLPGGAVVLDRELRVRMWIPRAEDLWGMRSDEAQGQHFLNLDIGLPVQQLRNGIRDCLAGEADHHEQVVDATNRRGRAIQCRVNFTPLLGSDDATDGVIVVMQEVNHDG